MLFSIPKCLPDPHGSANDHHHCFLRVQNSRWWNTRRKANQGLDDLILTSWSSNHQLKKENYKLAFFDYDPNCFNRFDVPRGVAHLISHGSVREKYLLSFNTESEKSEKKVRNYTCEIFLMVHPGNEWATPRRSLIPINPLVVMRKWHLKRRSFLSLIRTSIGSLLFERLASVFIFSCPDKEQICYQYRPEEVIHQFNSRATCTFRPSRSRWLYLVDVAS